MKIGWLAAASLTAMTIWSGDAPAQGTDPAEDLARAGPGVMDLTQVYSGYTYYNRPGADARAQDTDLKYCRSIAILGVQPSEKAALTNAVVAEALIGLAGVAATTGKTLLEINRGIAANIEDCMIVRGWRVVQLPNREGERLSKLDTASLRVQLGAWIGGDPPHGEIVRAWDDDLANGNTIKFREAGAVTHRSLSLVAQAKDLDAPPKRPPAGPQHPGSARQPNSLDARSLAGVSLGPDDAVIIARIRHPGVDQGLGVELERIGPDADTPAWYTDQRPFDLLVGKSAAFSTADGEIYAYVVPAGAWRLASLPWGVGLCFGAPAFTAKGGDVVYAGAFDFTADDIGPDMDLAPARALLKEAPSLVARLRAAEWVNGHTSLCRGTYFYAYEIKGAPTREGYVRGNAPLARRQADAAR
jgi:hypothetical protein